MYGSQCELLEQVRRELKESWRLRGSIRHQLTGPSPGLREQDGVRLEAGEYWKQGSQGLTLSRRRIL